MKEQTVRILLIEDDADDALLLTRLIEQGGWPAFRFTLERAQSLGEGLEALMRGGFGLVLLDLMLPDCRGLETVERVRSRVPEVPVVVLTGIRDEALGLEAVRRGAQDYQVKGSVDGHALKRTIAYAVQRHRAAAGLKSILDGSPDGMTVIDAAGVVRYVNPAAQALLGGDEAVLVGRPFPLPLADRGVGEAALPGEAGGRVAELRVTAIEWEEQPARLAAIRDITDLRRVAQLKAEVAEARRMDQLKTELMGAISHEMRGPLTIIRAANINMKDGSTGPLNAEQATMVLLQYTHISRLQKILNHVLDLSRLESGRAVIRPALVDAAASAREAVQGYQLLAAERGLKISLELPAGLPPVYADPDLLVQALGNLLDNAVRFARSRIVLRAEALSGAAVAGRSLERGTSAALMERGCVCFGVRDDGRGIPPERVGDVFTRFVQVDRAKGGGEYKGTGLGLAICREIVERQGGRIWAEGGAGARLYFTLPVGEPVLGD